MTRRRCRHVWMTYHFTDGCAAYTVPVYCDRCRVRWTDYYLARARRRHHVGHLLVALAVIVGTALLAYAVLALTDDMLASTWGGLA